MAPDEIKALKCKMAIPSAWELKNEPECKWYRAILPGSLLSSTTGWVQEEECQPWADENFLQVLRTPGAQAGTDGTGGKAKAIRHKKAASGAAVFVPETGELAQMYAATPGKQTVPRAELWAAILAARADPQGSRLVLKIETKN